MFGSVKQLLVQLKVHLDYSVKVILPFPLTNITTQYYECYSSLLLQGLTQQITVQLLCQMVMKREIFERISIARPFWNFIKISSSLNTALRVFPRYTCI